MSAVIKGLTVTLESDVHEDVIADIVHAIAMVKGVLSVDLVETDISDHMNRVRVRREFEQKLLQVLR